MGVQALMLSQKVAGGGGGAGLPPNGIGAGANLTFWYDADSSATYKLPGSDANPATANGDSVERIDSANAIARSFYSGAFAELLVPGVNGNKAIRSNPGNVASLYTKPSSGSAPSTTQNMSSLITTTNAVMIFAVKIDDGPADSGLPYGNPALIDCATQNMGLHYYKSGSNAVLQAYNFASAADVATKTVPLGSWFVVVYKHASSQMRIAVNGITYTSVASGTNAGLAGFARLHGALDASDDFTVAQFATYNIAVTDANILEVMRWMGVKVGVTI